MSREDQFMTAETGTFFRMRNIVKKYPMGDEEAVVLRNVNLDIDEGEYLSVLGPSGSGKSTLMNIVGCLDKASSGEYILHGKLIEALNESELAEIRGQEIGFIFQNSQLLPKLDAMKNVELPLLYAGVRPRKRSRLAKEMLTKVGLGDHLHHYPNMLSGGQQQRVAIARALVTDPSLLLADEPTGALDQTTGQQIMRLFLELHHDGRTIIMITHDLNVARNANRTVHIIDGKLTEGEVRA
jgi:putative ABC transport system ATP-binding protein